MDAHDHRDTTGGGLGPRTFRRDTAQVWTQWHDAERELQHQQAREGPHGGVVEWTVRYGGKLVPVDKTVYCDDVGRFKGARKPEALLPAALLLREAVSPAGPAASTGCARPGPLALSRPRF